MISLLQTASDEEARLVTVPLRGHPPPGLPPSRGEEKRTASWHRSLTSPLMGEVGAQRRVGVNREAVLFVVRACQ